MDTRQDDKSSQHRSTGKDFMKMVILTVVCIVGAVLIVKLLQAVM